MPPAVRANSERALAPRPKPPRAAVFPNIAYDSDSPSVDKLATETPMHAPVRRATRKPRSRPSASLAPHAAAVLQLPSVARTIPRYPAAAEKTAPSRNETDAAGTHPFSGPSIARKRNSHIAAPQGTSQRYSIFTNCMADSWTVRAMLLIASLPRGCARTVHANRQTAISPKKEAHIAAKTAG
eukprot:gene22826-biopygen23166